MRKIMSKKLFTYYIIEGNYDDIKNDPNHNLVSYSSGKAECIKYIDSITDWIEEISKNQFKNGFGVKALTNDGKFKIHIHRYDLECSSFVCKELSSDDLGRKMATILDYYFNSNPYYYEIKEDYTSLIKELTGHSYYNSIYESCDSCGNCNGAMCHICKAKYIVKDLTTDKIYYNGFDKVKAECVYKDNKKDYSDIIADILLNYEIDMKWFDDIIRGHSDIRALYTLLAEYKIPYINIE